jgi:hypothetical protein
VSKVESDGGLASPTLAQLYLEQGHTERAREICREVLEREPTNGHALVLSERLRRAAEASARVQARFVSSSSSGVDVGLGELELSWEVPRSLLDDHADARLDVVVAIASASRALSSPVGAVSMRYTSLRCLDLRASRRLEVPLGPASAAVTLILSPGPRRRSLTQSRRRPDLRVLAVAEPTSW